MSVAATVAHYIKDISKPKNLREMVSADGRRALGKLFALGALMAVVLPAQVLVAGPLFRDRDTVPQLMGRAMNRIMGIDVKFRGAAIVRDRPMIYFGNHLSWADSTVIGATLPGAMVAKAETSKFPVVGAFGRSIGAIYVERGHHGESLAKVHRQAAQTFNSGRSAVIFPEGHSSDGTGVLPFKSGFLSVLFSNLSDVKIAPPVAAQPFAMHITSLNGRKIMEAAQLRDIYNWYSHWTPENFWKVLKQKSIEVDVEMLPVMEPKDYGDFRQFTAAAENIVRERILRP